MNLQPASRFIGDETMKPNFLNLFMKKLTRDRVVPIIPARVS